MLKKIRILEYGAVQSTFFHRVLAIVSAGFVGLMTAFSIYGWEVINPTNVTWLLLEGDPFQHFIGWDAFRHDVWRWPLGAIPQMGTQVDSSIVYTDSIPLLAIPFKLISWALPENFQYQGLVMAFNMSLNAVAACWVALKVGARPLVSFFFSLLVLLAPIVLMRGLGTHGHEALTAHWLIIFSLGVALTFRNNNRAYLVWFVLLFMSVVVHFYIFFMVGALWFFWWMKSIFDSYKKDGPKALCARLALGSSFVIFIFFVMWSVGYFHYGLDIEKASGYGFFSAEGLTFLNPLSHAWFFGNDTLQSASRVLPGWQSPIKGQYEGQAYAGLGVMLFVLVSLSVLLRYFSAKEIRYLINNSWWVVAPALALFIFAMGDRWVIGKLVWEVPYPAFFDYFAQYLRSSGRLVWPLLYLIIVLSLLLCVEKLRSKFLSLLLLFCVWVQWEDVRPLNDFITDRLESNYRSTQEGAPYPAIENKMLVDMIKRKEMIYYLPGNNMGELKPYLWLSVRYGKPINVAYFARADGGALVKATKEEVNRVKNGIIDSKGVYILTESNIYDDACQYKVISCLELMDGNFMAYKNIDLY